MARYEQQREEYPGDPAASGCPGGRIFWHDCGGGGRVFARHHFRRRSDLQGQDWTWGNFLTCEGLVSPDLGEEEPANSIALDNPRCFR